MTLEEIDSALENVEEVLLIKDGIAIFAKTKIKKSARTSSRTHKGHGGKGLALFCYLNYNIATINKQYACPLVLLDLGELPELHTPLKACGGITINKKATT